MKTKKILKWFIGLSLGFGSVISIPIALTSCGTTKQYYPFNIGDRVKIDVISSLNSGFTNTYEGEITYIGIEGVKLGNTFIPYDKIKQIWSI